MAEVLQFVQNSGGLEYAEQRMKEFTEQALQMLADFPENDIRESMAELVDYVVTRKK